MIFFLIICWFSWNRKHSLSLCGSSPYMVSPPLSSVLPQSAPSPFVDDHAPLDTDPSQIWQCHTLFPWVPSPFEWCGSSPLSDRQRGIIRADCTQGQSSVPGGTQSSGGFHLEGQLLECLIFLFVMEHFWGFPEDKTFKWKSCVRACACVTQQAQTGEGELYLRCFT